MKKFIPEGPTEGVDRFGRKFKNWREWNNTKDFLSNLPIKVDYSDIFCVDPDPPDTVYKGARFEVKEIMDEGRRRHDEVKKEIAKYGRTLPFVSNPNGLFYDICPNDAANMAIKELEKYENKYKEKSQIDFLFYINKKHHFFLEGELNKNPIFENFGWRSVSCVIGSGTSIVFYASPEAPDFLKLCAEQYFHP